MNGERLAMAGGAMLVDPGLVVHADARWFDPGWWAAQGAIAGRGGGRGQVLFLRTPYGPWVLRRYRRGGLARVLSSELYLWLGEAHTRAFAEWRLLAYMHARGLPVPRPVAAAYTRHGVLGYSAWLLTAHLGPNRTLRELYAAGEVPPGAWPRIGRVLRRMHDTGVCHTDLNAGNILVGEHGRVHVVDFDQGFRRAPGRWIRGNLARLHRSLDKTARAAGRDGVCPAHWSALVAGYEAPPDDVDEPAPPADNGCA